MDADNSAGMPSHSDAASISNAIPDLAIDPLSRARFFETYCHQQTWSLPDSLMYYIAKNPKSPEAYQKMIQSCKYFFVKNPLLVVPRFCYVNRNNQWYACFNGKRIDLNNLTSKIWVTDILRIHNDHKIEQSKEAALTFVIPKIHQCDARSVTLRNLIISIKDLESLTQKCEELHLNKVTVKNEDGDIISLENLFAVLPNVKNFRYDLGKDCSNIVTSKTVEELLKMEHFLNLRSFYLFGTSDTFDIDRFYAYILKNKNTDLYLDFCDQLSAKYRTRLQIIVFEILASVNRTFLPPYIQFPNDYHLAASDLYDLYMSG